MSTELLERLEEADNQLDKLANSLAGSIDVRAHVQGKSLSDIDAELDAISGAVVAPQPKGRHRKGKHSAPPPPPASVRPKAPSMAPPAFDQITQERIEISLLAAERPRPNIRCIRTRCNVFPEDPDSLTP